MGAIVSRFWRRLRSRAVRRRVDASDSAHGEHGLYEIDSDDGGDDEHERDETLPRKAQSGEFPVARGRDSESGACPDAERQLQQLLDTLRSMGDEQRARPIDQGANPQATGAKASSSSSSSSKVFVDVAKVLGEVRGVGADAAHRVQSLPDGGLKHV